jgi:hypothetical protein
MKVSKNSPGWMISVEQLFPSQLREYSGTYRFQLTATADNALPVVFEIDVAYDRTGTIYEPSNGDCDRLSAQKVLAICYAGR